MACAGALTSIIMTVAASFIANGGLSEVFGAAPIGGAEALGSLGEVFVAFPDGTTQIMTTAQATQQGLIATQSQGWFSQLSTTLGEMKNAVLEFTAPMREAWNTISTAPVAAGNEVFMSTVGTYGPKTAEFLKTVTENSFRTAINLGVNWASTSLGGPTQYVAGAITGDPKVLGSIFSSAQSYVNTANSFVNAADNATTYLSKTFTSMDNTITAGMTGVSNWVQGLGDDISKLGDTVSWENLKNLGSPGQLMANMENNGTLGPMYDKLGTIRVSEKTAQELGYNVITAGYSVITGGKSSIGLTDLTRNISLKELGVDLNALARTGAALPPTVQKEIYGQLGTLSPTEVAQVKAILNNTQATVQQGQDLLNPQKLFGKSYTTLTTPIRTASVGYRAIYENDSGSVNPQLNHLGEDLKGIIPDDLAVANDAVARSFLQVKGIQNSTTEAIAVSTANLENLNDLPLIQNQTEYVPQGVIDFWKDQYNDDYDIKLSTGALDQMVLSDVIGFAAGYNSGSYLQDNATKLAELDAAGAFTEFTQTQGIYETIQAFSQGLFPPTAVPDPMDPMEILGYEVVIPGGWAAAGTYGLFPTALEAYEDAWINGIIPFTALANVDIINNNPVAQTVYNNENAWQEQQGREYLNRQRIDLDAAAILPSNNTAMSFAQQLPEYGKDTSFGGASMWLERVAVASGLGGQSIIAAMREGRNLERLAAAGLEQDAPLNTNNIEEPGTLSPNQYTKEQAEALVIRS
jgi:hypothetical protein